MSLVPTKHYYCAYYYALWSMCNRSTLSNTHYLPSGYLSSDCDKQIAQQREVCVTRFWHTARQDLSVAASAVEDWLGREGEGHSVLQISVRLRVGMTRVIPATVELHDWDCEGRILCIGTKGSQEHCQICLTGVLIYRSHDPDPVPVFCCQTIHRRLVQPAQVFRRDYKIVFRQHRPRLTRHHITPHCRRSHRALEWYLL